MGWLIAGLVLMVPLAWVARVGASGRRGEIAWILPLVFALLFVAVVAFLVIGTGWWSPLWFVAGFLVSGTVLNSLER